MRLQSFLAFMIVMASSAAAQQTTAGGLQKGIRGKKLVLRDFSAEPVVHYSWVDGSLAEPAVAVRTPAVFIPKDVKLKGGVLTIQGARATIEREPDKDKLGLSPASRVTLEIQLGSADPKAVIPQIRQLVFFPDIDAALATLPPDIAVRLEPKSKAKPDCKCTRIRQGNTWIQIALTDPRLKPPEILQKVEPEFTEEARAARMHGLVTFTFLLDEHGAPADLWLIHALGLGLDETAHAALKKYRFAPAMYEQKPVATRLTLEVNFQVY